jgi:Common central domain of tyrosinase/Polyphenol oxidase middle domain
MKNSPQLNRRHFLQGTGVIAAGAIAPISALAQDPPQCPVPPAGGTVFKAGQDTRPIVQRPSVYSLSSTQLSQLQQAFSALRALPSTDNRAWVLQADVHALYCQGCNNNKAQIHGTWSFYPWHRAWLYYYERILGSLVNNLDGFRLPYWDWENVRTLPVMYYSPGASSNSLWDGNRNSGMAAGGKLPTSDATASRIALLQGVWDFPSFAGTATTAGSSEDNPHGLIHVDVGTTRDPYRDMGNLGYAARDPIFFAHHCRMDKLWSNWNGLAASGQKPGAYMNPTDPNFLNMRWSFYDENGATVSISAGDVLNHQNILRYSYPASTIKTASATTASSALTTQAATPSTPAPLDTGTPDITTTSFSITLVTVSALEQRFQVDETVRSQALQLLAGGATFAIILQGVRMPPGEFTGIFDIVSVRRNNQITLGSLVNIPTSMPMARNPSTVVLDVTAALTDIVDSAPPPARLVISPRSSNATFPLQAESAELRAIMQN